jgi:molybdenum cofactor guanylyltransferase
VARRALTGVLLVGGASSRFGSPKALARVNGETLAGRGTRLLATVCEEVLVVGKRGELPLDMLDDATPVRAPIAGVVSGLRAAAHDPVLFLPVDCPLMTPGSLRRLGRACRDAAVPPSGPLPGAWAKSALAVLERRLAAGELSLREAYAELEVVTVDLDEGLLADADTPDALSALVGL